MSLLINAYEVEAHEEVIPAFVSWVKKGPSNAAPIQQNTPPQDEEDDEGDDGMEIDMDMTQAAGGIIRTANMSPSRNDDEDMSMDVTQALGAILSQQKAKTSQLPPSGDDSLLADATMDLTTAIGGVRPRGQVDVDNEGNEDMSMELTTVLGKVFAGIDSKKAVTVVPRHVPAVNDWRAASSCW